MNNTGSNETIDDIAAHASRIVFMLHGVEEHVSYIHQMESICGLKTKKWCLFIFFGGVEGGVVSCDDGAPWVFLD